MKKEKTKKEASKELPFFISYFITDPVEFGSESKQFEKSLRNTLIQHKINIICFRDKISINKKELAKICLRLAREFKISKVLINSDIELYNELDFDGIHLNSSQFNKIEELKNKKIFIVISCHTESEIQKAKNLQADAVTYSPIFFKEQKGVPIGLENLKEMVKRYQDETFDIIALGGIISIQNIKQIKNVRAKGFASIRYFKI